MNLINAYSLRFPKRQSYRFANKYIDWFFVPVIKKEKLNLHKVCELGHQQECTCWIMYKVLI